MNLRLLTDDEFEILDSAIGLKISQSKDLYYMCCGVGPYKEDIAEGERLRAKVQHIRQHVLARTQKRGEHVRPE